MKVFFRYKLKGIPSVLRWESIFIKRSTLIVILTSRELWQKKKQEEEELLFRDLEDLKELSRAKMFGRPGHGAPTRDIRKKKFTEHQMNSLTRSQSLFGLETMEPSTSPVSRYDSQPAVDKAVS